MVSCRRARFKPTADMTQEAVTTTQAGPDPGLRSVAYQKILERIETGEKGKRLHNLPLQPPYFTRRLGGCVGGIPYVGQTRQMVLIRRDRVALPWKSRLSVPVCKPCLWVQVFR